MPKDQFLFKSAAQETILKSMERGQGFPKPLKIHFTMGEQKKRKGWKGRQKGDIRWLEAGVSECCNLTFLEPQAQTTPPPPPSTRQDGLCNSLKLCHPSQVQQMAQKDTLVSGIKSH